MALDMSDTPGEHREGRLDAASRRTLSAWLARSLVLLVLAALPWCLGVRSLHETGGTVALAFSLSGVVAMLWATCNGDPIGRGSLNRWDEALTFNALSLLLHLLLRWA